MNNTLSKKNKNILLAVGVFIALGLVVQPFIDPGLNYRSSKENSSNDKPEELKRREVPITYAQDYLENLTTMPIQKREEILGIEEPIITRHHITNITGNNELSIVEARIYIGNSFLLKEILLTKQEDTWMVDSVRGDNVLHYENSGVILTHSTYWDAFPQDLGQEMGSGWRLIHSLSDTQIIFFRDLQGMFFKYFNDCSEDFISNCSSEEKDGKTFYYSTLGTNMRSRSITDSSAQTEEPLIVITDETIPESVNDEVEEIILSIQIF